MNNFIWYKDLDGVIVSVYMQQVFILSKDLSLWITFSMLRIEKPLSFWKHEWLPQIESFILVESWRDLLPELPERSVWKNEMGPEVLEFIYGSF